MLERVRDDVFRLAQPMPGGHIESSNIYVLRGSDGGIHLIDAGWDSDENLDRLSRGIAEIDATLRDVRSITATHLHPDHLGMADRIRAASGALVAVHRLERDALLELASNPYTLESVTADLERWAVPHARRDEFDAFLSRRVSQSAVDVDVLLEDDSVLEIPGFTLRVMRTPGHTPGHVCVRDDGRAILLTGDTVLQHMHAGLALGGSTPTNALADYLESLRSLSLWRGQEVLPGHGAPFHGLAQRAAEHAQHHLRRSREVAAVLGRGGHPSVWDVASQLTWTAGWENLKSFYLYSALAQTDMHRDYVESAA